MATYLVNFVAKNKQGDWFICAYDVNVPDDKKITDFQTLHAVSYSILDEKFRKQFGEKAVGCECQIMGFSKYEE